MLNAKRGKKNAKMQFNLLHRRGQGEMMMSQMQLNLLHGRGQGEMMMSQGQLSNPLKEADPLQFCDWEQELVRELKNPVPDVLSMELRLADTNNNLG